MVTRNHERVTCHLLSWISEIVVPALAAGAALGRLAMPRGCLSPTPIAPRVRDEQTPPQQISRPAHQDRQAVHAR
jgi:hypothetical protein